MDSKEFSKQLIREYDIDVIDGGALRINDAAPLPEEVDYNNDDIVNILATKAFQTAEGFYHLIKNNCNVVVPCVSSGARLEMYLALAGLACEIYMKSIVYFEKRHDGKQCRGHKLNELFYLLPDSHKEVIKKEVEDVEAILPSVGDAFESLRYDYELNRIHGNYLLLFDLMEVLRTMCDSYPKRIVGEMRYVNGTISFE